MKAKTIKKVLKGVHSEWLESIEDEDVREIAKKNTIITGGCIASMLLQEKVNDYDLYFRNFEAAEKIAHYYVNKFVDARKAAGRSDVAIFVEVDEETKRIKIVCKSAGVASEDANNKKPYAYFEGRPEGEAGEYLDEAMQERATDLEEAQDSIKEKVKEGEAVETKKFRPVFLSTNAVTLSNKLQLVFRFYGEPDEIHENYDFVHCMNYWTSWDNELELRQEALEALLARELRYIGSRYPVCSIIRTRKFIKRGWSINAGQYLKMCMQVSALDLNDLKTLEDQLTGVDTAYFMEVIEICAKKAGESDRIDTAYLVEVIDRMF